MFLRSLEKTEKTGMEVTGGAGLFGGPEGIKGFLGGALTTSGKFFFVESFSPFSSGILLELFPRPEERGVFSGKKFLLVPSPRSTN